MTAASPPGLEHLTSLLAGSPREHAFEATTVSAARRWQRRARGALRDILGLERMRRELAGHEVSVEVLTTEDLGLLTRSRAILHSEPDVDLPLWVLRPASQGPFPLALLPHGHTDWGADQYVGLYRTEAEREKIVTKHKDLAVQAARRGFACVIPVTRGFEPARAPGSDGLPSPPCHRQLVQCLLAGRTPLGERLWDLLHSFGWARAQPWADPARTLVIGHSGGGVLSTFAAALDERITVAAANESVCPFVTEDGQTLWCDCNTIPGLLRWGQAWDLIGLIAPRHFLAVNGRHGLYPPDQVSRTIDHARPCYAVWNRPEHLRLRFGEAGCLFYEHVMWELVESVVPGLTSPDRVPGVPYRLPEVPSAGLSGVTAAGEAAGPPGEVSLRPVRRDDVEPLTRLRVHPFQERFLPGNGVTIGQALLRPATWLRAVYADDVPVGLVAVVDRKPSAEWAYLWRFMIGAEHQGLGYGMAALRLVLAEFAGRPGTRFMYLKYLPEPGSARAFYQRAGFRDTGEGDGRDSIMTITLSDPRAAGPAMRPC